MEAIEQILKRVGVGGSRHHSNNMSLKPEPPNPVRSRISLSTVSLGIYALDRVALGMFATRRVLDVTTSLKGPLRSSSLWIFSKNSELSTDTCP